MKTRWRSGAKVSLLLVSKVMHQQRVLVLNNILKLRSADYYSSWGKETPQTKKQAKLSRLPSTRSENLTPSVNNRSPVSQNQAPIEQNKSLSASSHSQVSTPASQFRAPNPTFAPNPTAAPIPTRSPGILTPRSESSVQAPNSDPITSPKASSFLLARQNSLQNSPNLSKFNPQKPHSSFKPGIQNHSPMIGNHNNRNLDESFDSDNNNSPNQNSNFMPKRYVSNFPGFAPNQQSNNMMYNNTIDRYSQDFSKSPLEFSKLVSRSNGNLHGHNGYYNSRF